MSPNLNIIPDKKFSLQDLQSLVQDDLRDVDIIIDESLKSDIELIETVTKHIIYAGGKRIRPLLTLICSKTFSLVSPPETKYLAAAIEFIHTATLLHDDVVDESDLRRGSKTAHKIWGNSTPILVGDYLFARAFELMVKTNNLTILEILSQTSAKIAAGEVLQLTYSHSLDLKESIALEIMGAKTAELFASACQAGAIAGGAPPQQAQILYQYGYGLGIAFQIMDDILDYTSVPNRRGKNLGDDFNEGKITLPLIYAYQRASLEDKTFLKKIFSDPTRSLDGFSSVFNMIELYDGFKIAQTTAQRFARGAMKDLELISSPLVHYLRKIITYCLDHQS